MILEKIIENSLKNLNSEAHKPLVQLAKNKLDIDIIGETSIIDVAQELYSRVPASLKNKSVYSVLQSQTVTESDIIKAIKSLHPYKYWKYIKQVSDTYYSLITSAHFKNQANVNNFTTKILKHGKEKLVKKIDKKISKLLAGTNSYSEHDDVISVVRDIIDNIEDKNKIINNVNKLKNLTCFANPKVKYLLGELLVTRQDINQDETTLFNVASDSKLAELIQNRVNNRIYHQIKKAQTELIYKNDGFVRRYVPVSCRGLNNLPKNIIMDIAMNGDRGRTSDTDLFNNEIAFGIRENKTYAVGHTGSSNVSTSMLDDIPMYSHF